MYKRMFESRYRRKAKSQPVWYLYRNIVSSGVPIFISIVALSLSIWSALETRGHNKLSVRPEVQFWSRGAIEEKYVGLFIENRGLGPAEVHLAVFSGTERIFDWTRISDSFLKSGILQTEKDDIKYIPSWTNFDPKIVLKSGESLGLYFIDPKYLKDNMKFKNQLDYDVRIIGYSCSLYRDCSFVCFGRWDHDCATEARRNEVFTGAAP